MGKMIYTRQRRDSISKAWEIQNQSEKANRDLKGKEKIEFEIADLESRIKRYERDQEKQDNCAIGSKIRNFKKRVEQLKEELQKWEKTTVENQ